MAFLAMGDRIITIWRRSNAPFLFGKSKKALWTTTFVLVTSECRGRCMSKSKVTKGIASMTGQ